MKQIRKLQDLLIGLNHAFGRYPVTALFLVAAAAVNAVDISTGKDYSKFLITFVVGAFLTMVMQVVFERFFFKAMHRWTLMGAAFILTVGYYLVIIPAPRLGIEIGIRTSVALFALLVAFIWVPAIKNSISFNESFMIAFKSFFNSLLFSGVIMAGISIIITAIDRLLFQVNGDAYSHTANIDFILFAPMYFLSLIPVFPGAADWEKDKSYAESKEEKVNKAAYCPKFLEILISYIIIPLLAVFTIILVIYILRNIGGKFWTDNLLEPMLVSYSITVILLYILASRVENRFTVFFRRLFPKLLVPIVLFQIASSVISLGETGLTHTRYYVILFGIFAAVSGVVLSIVPVRKNGIVAALLIIFAVVSIVPPIDAFTASRINQTQRLEKALQKNGMLVDNTVVPKESIPEGDKKTIAQAFDYLRMMEYTDRLQWLPEDFNEYTDFPRIFGFNEYEIPVDQNSNVYVGLEQKMPIDIKGYDSMVYFNIRVYGEKLEEKICDIIKSDRKYVLKQLASEDESSIILAEEGGKELISFNTREIIDRFYNYNTGKGIITTEEATFSKENGSAKITFVIQNLNIDKSSAQTFYNADLYALVMIK